MKVMYLRDFELRIGFGYGTEKDLFDQKCIWITDALTFELRTSLNLEAKYPRIVVSFNSPQALDAPRTVFFAGSKSLNLPRYAELRLVATHDIFLGSAVELRNNVRVLLQDNLSKLFPKLECDETALRQLINDILLRDELFELPIKPLSLESVRLGMKIQIFFRTTDRHSEIYAVIERVNSPVRTQVSVLEFERPISLLGFLNTKLSIKNDKLVLRSHDKKHILAEIRV